MLDYVLIIVLINYVIILLTYGIPGYKITFYSSFLFYVYYVISTIISPSSYNVIHKVVISLYTPSIVFTTYTLIADHNPH